ASVVGAVLWMLWTYVYDVFNIAPRFLIKSPTKRCGKTRLMSLGQALCRRGLLASNVSPGSIYRIVDQNRPTLLLDEADTYVPGNEALRGILNSGHTRSAAWVIRSVEARIDRVGRKFSTWCPIGIACIGRIADTLED